MFNVHRDGAFFCCQETLSGAQGEVSSAHSGGTGTDNGLSLGQVYDVSQPSYIGLNRRAHSHKSKLKIQ